MKGYAPLVRPWLKAGLNVLLMEDEERVLELRAVSGAAAEKTAVRELSGGEPPAPASRSAMSQRSPVRPQIEAGTQATSRRSASPAPSADGKKQSVVPSRLAPQPAKVRAGQSLLAAPGALPVERWPAEWLALKDRRPLPQRPLVLWSYAGLGEDLAGMPDEARKRVIVRMLTELRHPAGTHVFWPFALAGEGLSSEASLFWSGVSLLDPRVLLLFGSDTRDALEMPKSLLPFCQARVHGRLVIQLPRPQALAADESAFRQAQAFLARILSFCAKR